MSDVPPEVIFCVPVAGWYRCEDPLAYVSGNSAGHHLPWLDVGVGRSQKGKKEKEEKNEK